MNGRLANAKGITKQLLCSNFRPEVVSDVISGTDVEQVGMNALVKFGDFRSNRYRHIQLLHLAAFCLINSITSFPVKTDNNSFKRVVVAEWSNAHNELNLWSPIYDPSVWSTWGSGMSSFGSPPM